MGWKSTVEISRDEVIELILLKVGVDVLNKMSNRDLENMVESLGFGDNIDLPYFGHNFYVVNNKEKDNPQD